MIVMAVYRIGEARHFFFSDPVLCGVCGCSTDWIIARDARTRCPECDEAHEISKHPEELQAAIRRGRDALECGRLGAVRVAPPALARRAL